MFFGWRAVARAEDQAVRPGAGRRPRVLAVRATPPRRVVAVRSSAFAEPRQADAPPSASSSAAAASRRGRMIEFKGPPDMAARRAARATGGETGNAPSRRASAAWARTGVGEETPAVNPRRLRAAQAPDNGCRSVS